MCFSIRSKIHGIKTHSQGVLLHSLHCMLESPQEFNPPTELDWKHTADQLREARCIQKSGYMSICRGEVGGGYLERRQPPPLMRGSPLLYFLMSANPRPKIQAMIPSAVRVIWDESKPRADSPSNTTNMRSMSPWLFRDTRMSFTNWICSPYLSFFWHWPPTR